MGGLEASGGRFVQFKAIISHNYRVVPLLPGCFHMQA
jgi:hypothetical protein